jgi:hypothetical protein
MALAHAVSDKTVAAYNRSDLSGTRRRPMQSWAEFLTETLRAGHSSRASQPMIQLNRRG